MISPTNHLWVKVEGGTVESPSRQELLGSLNSKAQDGWPSGKAVYPHDCLAGNTDKKSAQVQYRLNHHRPNSVDSHDCLNPKVQKSQLMITAC